jgi:hypothetical protein
MQHLRLAPPVIWVRCKISVPCCNSQCLRALTYPLLLRLYPTWMIPHSLWKTLIGRLSLSSITSSRQTPRSGHPRLQVQLVLPPITHLNPCLQSQSSDASVQPLSQLDSSVPPSVFLPFEIRYFHRRRGHYVFFVPGEYNDPVAHTLSSLLTFRISNRISISIFIDSCFKSLLFHCYV